jgi:nitrite reductase/ring-hydroxylating ferredoxin subunit
VTEKTFVRAGSKNAISGGVAIVRAGSYDVAVFDVDGELYAYENACPHQGGPIGEGVVENGTVTCPWHAWCFDLRSGSMTLGDFARLRRFQLRVEGDAIFIANQPEERL